MSIQKAIYTAKNAIFPAVAFALAINDYKKTNKYLHISKKSSKFAENFERGLRREGVCGGRIGYEKGDKGISNL